MNPLSWERSSYASSFENGSPSNNHKSSHKTTYRSSTKSSRLGKSSKSLNQSKLDLLTFGYGCKLFNDEEQARYLDQGKNLIPFDGNKNLLIDRFDVRGYLNAIDLQKYEAKIDVNYTDLLVDDEIEFEKKLDEERYRDLYINSGNKINDEKKFDYNYEDEFKKLKESIQDDKKYNQIHFDYNNVEKNANENTRINSSCFNNNVSEEKFVLPKDLSLPNDIQQPSTMKEHNLIAKTAKFISKQGVQMEILLKTKQSSNSQFDFLSYNSPLNPYYRFLVQSIKDGHYKPIDVDEDNSISQSSKNHHTTDEESDDGGYLHPSLLSSNRPSYNLTTNKPPANSLYSKLAENLKDKIVVNDRSILEPKIIESKPIKYDINNKQNNESDIQQNYKQMTIEKESKSVKSVFDLIPEVPSEIKLIIEKLAQYVLKNGDEFEKQVKSRNESRFDFLNPGHKYHYYYVKTKLKFLNEKRKQEKQSNPSHSLTSKPSSTKNSEVHTLLSSSISEKLNNEPIKNPKSIQPFMISSKKSTTSFKDDLEAKQIKEKQEERKRKATLFLNKLKMQKCNENTEQSLNDEKSNDQMIGPQLPVNLKKESLRNTPSPLKDLFDELDQKTEKGRKQKQLFDESYDNNDSKTLDSSLFKSTLKISKQFRIRDDSSDDDKKSDVSMKRSLSKESNNADDQSPDRKYYRSRCSRSDQSPYNKYHRSRRSRSRSKRRSKSKSSSRRHFRRSRSKDRRSRDRHKRDRSKDRKSQRS